MRSREPLVSLIIPVYNRAKFIQETIQSVKVQSYSNWELILVDDGSTDGSLDLMLKMANLDPRIYVYHRPKERLKGGNAARNFGFEMSNGEYVNWFDSDDLMHPDFIKNKVQKFKEEPHLDLVLSKTIRVYSDGTRELENRTYVSENLLEEFITRKLSWYLFDGMFHKKYLFKKNLFNENLLAGQDRDFYIRLFTTELPKIKVVDFFATNYRIHTESISEKIYRKGDLRMQISHYRSLLNQVKILREKGKLSSNLRNHYLRELKKRLPAIVRSKLSFLDFMKNILLLSRLNKITVWVWCQIITAYISFMLFGKGERFIR